MCQNIRLVDALDINAITFINFTPSSITADQLCQKTLNTTADNNSRLLQV